ncbi:hypothetical protein AAES_48964 [Amazona aestiva]|uniref:Uncharacterized protein n=1 Tax=Amazona aestiva TaxID=12930 RepID=A0A0Q3MPR3_AMAAE|nr:hypothetical protein AAES_48964 [Amazona aestiva]
MNCITSTSLLLVYVFLTVPTLANTEGFDSTYALSSDNDILSNNLAEKAFIGSKNLAGFILFSCMSYETDGKWQEKEFSLPPYEIQSLMARSEAEPRLSLGN